MKRKASGWSAMRRAFRALLAIAVLGYAPGANAVPNGSMAAAIEMSCCGGDASPCPMGLGACAQICQGALSVSDAFAASYADPVDSIGAALRPGLGRPTGEIPLLASGPVPGGPPAYLLYLRLLL